MFAYTAEKIFTGREWLEGYVVLVEDTVIADVVPQAEVAKDVEIKRLEGKLVPGLIDVQVYGAGGKLLSVYPEAATLRTMYEVFVAEGTVLFQPTVATNTMPVFRKCIDAVRDYWNKGGKGVHGLHLEGPWLNAEKRGAHIKEWIHAPDASEVEEILEYGKGVVTMVTLAPEICSNEIISKIQSYGIIVAAGHSNTSYERAVSSFDKGIATVTHLYNAMSPLQHRAPGLAGAVLNHNRVRASIIPDGHHVDFPAISIAKKIMGSRLFAITDAVTETTEGPYQHYLAGDKYESGGILSGSAISMYRAYRNLVQKAGVDQAEALRMCSLYPAEVLGIAATYGRIAPGYSAQMTLIDESRDKATAINV